jgi:hypothetical protein
MRSSFHEALQFTVAALAVYATLSGLPAQAAQTKSYVVSWFHVAQYYGGDSDCPQGYNPPSVDFYRRDLLRIYPKKVVDDALKNFPGEDVTDQPWIPLVATRGNGKDNVYVNPTTVPDAHLKQVQGHFAYGFNLDGKGAASPNSFEEPETHELGVNNQLYRAMGCIRSYRAGPPPDRPPMPAQIWDNMRDQVPAWLISITSDQDGDGPVTVVFDRAVEVATRDSSGGARADMTFHIDPDPRGHNVLHGVRKGDRITTEPASMTLLADPFLLPKFEFTDVHLRLDLKPDGSLRGILGAYQPWYPIYAQKAVLAFAFEYATSVDVPALYYALKNAADGDPDPKTGENRSISSSYLIEAVPAFAVPVAAAKNAS